MLEIGSGFSYMSNGYLHKNRTASSNGIQNQFCLRPIRLLHLKTALRIPLLDRACYSSSYSSKGKLVCLPLRWIACSNPMHDRSFVPCSPSRQPTPRPVRRGRYRRATARARRLTHRIGRSKGEPLAMVPEPTVRARWRDRVRSLRSV